MHARVLCLGVIGLLACGDDAAPAGTAGSGAPSGMGSGGSSGPGEPGLDAGPEEGTGMLGPTSRIRIVQLVPDVTYDAWGPDTAAQPVKLASELAYGAISEYFDAPINRAGQYPIFLLLPTDADPPVGGSFLVDVPEDGVRVEARGLDGPDGQATMFVKLPEGDTVVSTSELVESGANPGEPDQANLRVSFSFEPGELEGGVQPALGVAGEPECLFFGSTSTQLVHSVSAGSFELGVYDTQSVSDCTIEPLSTLALEVAAGASELVVVYRDGTAIEWLHAPIEIP